MEVQNPFIVNLGLAFTDPNYFNTTNFSEFILARIAHHPKGAIAGIDSAATEASTRRWHYSELRQWVARCKQRLGELGVGRNCRLALITATTYRVVFVHLASGELEATVVCINGWASAEEVWHQLEEVECTHAVVETQFTSKVEESRRKALMRGINRCRVVRSLDEVLGEQKLTSTSSQRTQQKKDSSNALLDQAKKPSEMESKEEKKEEKLDAARKTPAMINNGMFSSMAATSAPRHSVRRLSVFSSTNTPVVAVDERPHTPNAIARAASPSRGAAHMSQPQGSTRSGNRPVLILFTFSGSSLQPKPVGITTSSLVRNLLQISHPMYGPPEVGEQVLLPVSTQHIFGVLSLYTSMLGGATLITVPKYSPKSLAAAVERSHATRLYLTTNMAQTLAKSEELSQLGAAGQLQRIIVGGSRFEASLRTANAKLQQMYVTTELGGCCAMTPVCSAIYGCATATDTSSRGLGWPLPATIFKVVTFENSKVLCPPRQLGHLLCHGPQISPLEVPSRNTRSSISSASGNQCILDAITSLTMPPMAIESRRYVKTGDAGYYDEHGHIVVMDRASDVIRYRGTLLCPSEMESTLRIHLGVDDCAVVGRSSNPYSANPSASHELPTVFIVRSTNHPHLSSADIKQHVAGLKTRVGDFPGGIYFVAEIPRSVGGRIHRRHLKQLCDRERLVGPLQQLTRGNGRGRNSSDSEMGLSSPMSTSLGSKGASTPGRDNKPPPRSDRPIRRLESAFNISASPATTGTTPFKRNDFASAKNKAKVANFTSSDSNHTSVGAAGSPTANKRSTIPASIAKKGVLIKKELSILSEPDGGGAHRRPTTPVKAKALHGSLSRL